MSSSTKAEPQEVEKEGAWRSLEAGAFRRALLEWFDAHQRQLPWRGIDDPYAVWVSEVMLQQTRVATVIDYFERWMKRFANVENLAEAPVEEVLELWSGLGYYRRARHLHQAAKKVVSEYGGQLPRRASELKKLPGVGPYTAGAVASIAFGEVEPVVDGNVMRVATRLEAIEGDPRKGEVKRRIWELAARWVDPQRPGDFNQAMMELGSQVCTVRAPRCGSCAVRQWCRAKKEGDPERYPSGTAKKSPQPMRGRCCVVYCQDEEGSRSFLLRRRREDGLLGGLWGFPGCEKIGQRWPTVDELAQQLQEPLGETSPEDMERSMGTVTHIFSHRRLKMRVHQLRVRSRQSPPGERWRWVGAKELDQVASSALLGKIHQHWQDS